MDSRWPCQNSKVQQDLDEMWLELQISEDTCKEHDIFCCEECFDMEEDE
jgi:hypothetical protein